MAQRSILTFILLLSIGGPELYFEEQRKAPVFPVVCVVFQLKFKIMRCRDPPFRSSAAYIAEAPVS